MNPDEAQCPRVFAAFRSLHDATDEDRYRVILELACELELENIALRSMPQAHTHP